MAKIDVDRSRACFLCGGLGSVLACPNCAIHVLPHHRGDRDREVACCGCRQQVSQADGKKDQGCGGVMHLSTMEDVPVGAQSRSAWGITSVDGDVSTSRSA